MFAAAERGATVVTANRHAARKLRADFGRLQVSRGVRTWRSPDFVAWSALLSRLWRQAVQGSEQSLPAILSSSQEAQLWQQIAGGDRWRNAAKLVSEAWRLAREYHIDLRSPAVRRRFRGREEERFLQWSDGFARRCRELDTISDAELPGALLPQLAHAGVPREMVSVGFDTLTPAQLAVLEAMRACGTGLHAIPASTSSATPKVFAFEDSADEFRAVAQWARECLQRDPQASLGIIVPRLAQHRAVLERELSAALQPANLLPGEDSLPLFHFSLGRSLAEHAATATALLLLHWCASPLTLDEISLLLRSPFFAGAEQERWSRAQLDLQLRREASPRLSAQAVWKFATRKDASFSSPLLAKMLGAVQFASTLPASPSEWRAEFTSILRRFGWPGSRPLRRSEFQLQRRWEELLSEYAALDRFAGALTLPQAIELLERLAAEAIFEPEDRGAPVQVMGALEAAGCEFDALWVTSLDSDTWPAAASPNPFLPRDLQREKKLPHSIPGADLEFARAVLQRLSASAADVTYSYPQRSGDCELRVSALISGLSVKIPQRRSPAVWYELLPYAAHLCAAATAPPFTGEAARGGKTVLQLQAACPFRAFAEIRLHARGADVPEEGPDAGARGTLLHCVMKALWEELQTQNALLQLTPENTRAAVQRAIEAGLREQSRSFRGAAGEHFREVERLRLEPIILGWLDEERRRAPFTVAVLEEQRECEIAGLRVNVARDRVDQLADGRRIVLDYKTGQISKRAWEGDRPDDPQLPLYALAEGDAPVAAVAFAQVKSGAIGFRGVQEQRGLLPGDVQTLPPSIIGESGMATETARWREVLGNLAKDFLAGEAAVDPKAGHKTCRLCPLPAVCRIAELRSVAFEDGEDE